MAHVPTVSISFSMFFHLVFRLILHFCGIIATTTTTTTAATTTYHYHYYRKLLGFSVCG